MNLPSYIGEHPGDQNEFDRKSYALRGVNNNNISEPTQLLTDTIEVGLYGQIAPEDFLAKPGRVYHDNEKLWSDLLNRAIRHGDSITLENFEILEWLPTCPGRYFTPRAKESRDTAQWLKDQMQTEYLPIGKAQMVLGGVGSVRLAPRFVRGGEVSFFCATSNGISHQGIPIVMPIGSSRNVFEEIKYQGACSGTLTGTLWPLPVDQSPLSFDRGVSKYYLFAENFRLNNSISSSPLVTVAITYSSVESHMAGEQNTFNDYEFAFAKKWSYASFNPSKGAAALDESVAWLRQYVQRYSDYYDPLTGKRAKVELEKLSIVGDFDEYCQYFDNPIEFPLPSILKGNYNTKFLEIYGRALHITINKTVIENQKNIMGDNFENIYNTTIVNRSLVEKSFNKVKSEFDEETANALKIVAAEIEKSGDQEATDKFNAFNKQLQEPKPDKDILEILWNKTTKALPSLLQMTDIAEKITKLFIA